MWVLSGGECWMPHAPDNFLRPAPGPDRRQPMKSVDQGAGVLLIVKNYDGDVMNFEMAAEIAGARGIDLATLIIGDDAAATGGNRRGIAGTLFAQKILGAAAEQGMSLQRLRPTGQAGGLRHAHRRRLAEGCGVFRRRRARPSSLPMETSSSVSASMVNPALPKSRCAALTTLWG